MLGRCLVCLQTEQAVHVKICLERGITCLLSTIYGSPQINGCAALWRSIESLANNNSLPWMLQGDFNTIMHPSKRSGGERTSL